MKTIQSMQDNAISNDLSKRKLEILASSNPYHHSSESLLLDYYSHIKATWSKSAIDSLRKQYGLKLNKKIDRCFFSAIAAKFELNNANLVKHNFRVGQQLNEVTLANPISHSSADNLKQIKTLSKNDSSFAGVTLEHNLSFITSHCSKNLQSQATEKTPKPLEQEIQETQTKLSSLEKQLELKQEQLQLTEAKLELQASMLNRANLELKEQQENIDRKEEIIEEKSNKLNQIDRFTFLLLTHRLLEPGPPLNGTENSPAMKILGSPTTLTELRSNYKKLVASEHPDFSPYPEDEAVKRFLYLRSLYQIVYEKWERLKPTAQISDAVKQKRMNAPVPWQPETFWRNIA